MHAKTMKHKQYSSFVCLSPHPRELLISGHRKKNTGVQVTKLFFLQLQASWCSEREHELHRRDFHVGIDLIWILWISPERGQRPRRHLFHTYCFDGKGNGRLYTSVRRLLSSVRLLDGTYSASLGSSIRDMRAPFCCSGLCKNCRCLGCLETDSLQNLRDFGEVLSPQNTFCQVPGCVVSI
ncbi:hypothetical protein BJV82DRAFT_283159 [Fennellomyces sp. T-0311]|nr:hypothetical protein BJV82DRAFT_283159 [Fennellomyces sp. T-0311]